jgi:hypothetical protein
MKLWVDSLCIDQDNIQEKDVEIKRMTDIYTKLRRIVSYLGMDENDSGYVLEVLNAIAEATAFLIETEIRRNCSRILSEDLQSELVRSTDFPPSVTTILALSIDNLRVGERAEEWHN